MNGKRAKSKKAHRKAIRRKVRKAFNSDLLLVPSRTPRYRRVN